VETSAPPPPSPDPAPLPPSEPDEGEPRRFGAWLAGGPPQPGQLTPGWRLTVLVTWVLAFLGWSAAWKASRELGLATWWLGPTSAPRPWPIMLLPFAPVVVMLVLSIQNARHLPWYGLAASGVGAAIAIGDLGQVTRLGLVELAISVATALVSVASLGGRYRRSVRSNRPL
jgi:hypothetical protein